MGEDGSLVGVIGDYLRLLARDSSRNSVEKSVAIMGALVSFTHNATLSNDVVAMRYLTGKEYLKDVGIEALLQSQSVEENRLLEKGNDKPECPTIESIGSIESIHSKEKFIAKYTNINLNDVYSFKSVMYSLFSFFKNERGKGWSERDKWNAYCNNVNIERSNSASLIKSIGKSRAKRHYVQGANIPLIWKNILERRQKWKALVSKEFISDLENYASGQTVEAISVKQSSGIETATLGCEKVFSLLEPQINDSSGLEGLICEEAFLENFYAEKSEAEAIVAEELSPEKYNYEECGVKRDKSEDSMKTKVELLTTALTKGFGADAFLKMYDVNAQRKYGLSELIKLLFKSAGIDFPTKHELAGAKCYVYNNCNKFLSKSILVEITEEEKQKLNLDYQTKYSVQGASVSILWAELLKNDYFWNRRLKPQKSAEKGQIAKEPKFSFQEAPFAKEENAFLCEGFFKRYNLETRREYGSIEIFELLSRIAETPLQSADKTRILSRISVTPKNNIIRLVPLFCKGRISSKKINLIAGLNIPFVWATLFKGRPVYKSKFSNEFITDVLRYAEIYSPIKINPPASIPGKKYNVNNVTQRNITPQNVTPQSVANSRTTSTGVVLQKTKPRIPFGSASLEEITNSDEEAKKIIPPAIRTLLSEKQTNLLTALNISPTTYYNLNKVFELFVANYNPEKIQSTNRILMTIAWDSYHENNKILQRIVSAFSKNSPTENIKLTEIKGVDVPFVWEYLIKEFDSQEHYLPQKIVDCIKLYTASGRINIPKEPSILPLSISPLQKPVIEINPTKPNGKNGSTIPVEELSAELSQKETANKTANSSNIKNSISPKTIITVYQLSKVLNIEREAIRKRFEVHQGGLSEYVFFGEIKRDLTSEQINCLSNVLSEAFA